MLDFFHLFKDGKRYRRIMQGFQSRTNFALDSSLFQESRSGKDSLETLHDAAIPLAVLEEVKEVEHLGGSAKSHNPAALAKGEGCDPDGNEPVLTVGDGCFIMHLPQ